MISRIPVVVGVWMCMALIGDSSTRADLLPGGMLDDGDFSVLYDARTGEIGLDVPFGFEVTSMAVQSASSIFTADPAENLGGSLDHDRVDSIFKATIGDVFGSVSFGSVGQPGLSESFLLGDLTVLGTTRGGGGVGDTVSPLGPSAPVDLVYIPEPSTLVGVFMGVTGFALWLGGRHLSCTR